MLLKATTSLISTLIIFGTIHGMENNKIEPQLLANLKRKRDDFELLRVSFESAFEENQESIDNNSWNDFAITEEERFSVVLYFADKWKQSSYENEASGKNIMERIHITHKKFRRSNLFSTTVFDKLKNHVLIEQIVMEYLNLDDYRVLKLFYPKVMQKIHTTLGQSYDQIYGKFKYANGFYFCQDESWKVYSKNGKIDTDETQKLQYCLTTLPSTSLDERKARAVSIIFRGARHGRDDYLLFQEVIEQILFADEFGLKSLFFGFLMMLNQGLCNNDKGAATLLRRAITKPKFLNIVLESIRKRGLKLIDICEDVELELLLNVHAKETWDCLHEDDIEYLVLQVYKSADRCFYLDGNESCLSSYKKMKKSRFEKLLGDEKLLSLYSDKTLQNLSKYRNHLEHNWNLVQDLIKQNMKRKILKN